MPDRRLISTSSRPGSQAAVDTNSVLWTSGTVRRARAFRPFRDLSLHSVWSGNEYFRVEFQVPELTNTKDIVLRTFCVPGFGCLYTVTHGSDFDVAEGGTFAWTAPHNTLRFKFSHRVTNGGGLLGVVKLYLVTADYRRALSQRWAFQANLLYGNNTSITSFTGNEYLDSLTATAGLWRNINPSWAASFSYSVIDQKQNNIPGYTIPHWIDNRIAFSLQYNWGHSLGR